MTLLFRRLSSVRDFRSTFYDASEFNQDISGWDVSNVASSEHSKFSDNSPLSESNKPKF